MPNKSVPRAKNSGRRSMATMALLFSIVRLEIRSTKSFSRI